jgi:MarR family transcriptional regulator, organic hydroperoxide resistance regulator
MGLATASKSYPNSWRVSFRKSWSPTIGDRLRQVGGTLTGVLDRMEERGLVRRERDQCDRRIWRIWLTEAGKQLEQVLPTQAAAIYEKALQGRSEAERRLFSEWIDQMIANLS